MSAAIRPIRAFRSILILVSVLFHFSSPLADSIPLKFPIRCIPFFEKFKGQEYPKSIKESGPGTEHNHFQFGYEIEYPLVDLEKSEFLRYYAPDEKLMALSEWEKLTLAKRAEWLKTNLKKVFPSLKDPGRMRLIQPEAAYSIPETVVLDSTGNIEIITHQPFDRYREFKLSFEQVVNLFGSGYMQAMISYPGSVVYHSKITSDTFIGLRFFLGELDQLEKLQDAHQIYELKKNSNKPYIPAKSFAHPYLGPMNSSRAEFFRSLVEENRFDRFSTEVLDRVSGENGSYKYTSQSVYRPDILRTQKRVLVEIRDCVKDPDCIKARLEREMFFLKHTKLELFKNFSNVKHFDAIAHFNLFPSSVQNALKKAFPRKLERPLETESGGEILAGEIYRNFSYPLNDWSSWLRALGFKSDSKEGQNVQKAALSYRSKLEAAAQNLKEDDTKSIELFENQARIALTQFAVESKLGILLKDWLKKHFSDYPL